MNTIPNPDNWMDVVTILIATAIVAVPSWLAARNHRVIKAVKDQVVNGHQTPMRADLDVIKDDVAGLRDVVVDLDVIKDDVAGLRDELRGGFNSIRADIAEERSARRAGDSAIRDEIARHHPAE